MVSPLAAVVLAAGAVELLAADADAAGVADALEAAGVELHPLNNPATIAMAISATRMLFNFFKL